MPDQSSGTLPPWLRPLGAAARVLPMGPILTHALRDLARRRPGLFERLGPHRRARFVLVPQDLPFAFLVVPDGRDASVRVVAAGAEGDVTVRGPILALLGLLDGSLDGDALFFCRTISVSGRTDALLALRNAMEAAELRPSDLLALPFAPSLPSPLARWIDQAAGDLSARLRAHAAPAREMPR